MNLFSLGMFEYCRSYVCFSFFLNCYLAVVLSCIFKWSASCISAHYVHTTIILRIWEVNYSTYRFHIFSVLWKMFGTLVMIYIIHYYYIIIQSFLLFSPLFTGFLFLKPSVLVLFHLLCLCGCLPHQGPYPSFFFPASFTCSSLIILFLLYLSGNQQFKQQLLYHGR